MLSRKKDNEIVFCSPNPSQLAEASHAAAKNETGNELTGRPADPQHTEFTL